MNHLRIRAGDTGDGKGEEGCDRAEPTDRGRDMCGQRELSTREVMRMMILALVARMPTCGKTICRQAILEPTKIARCIFAIPIAGEGWGQISGGFAMCSSRNRTPRKCRMTRSHALESSKCVNAESYSVTFVSLCRRSGDLQCLNWSASR